MKIRFISDIHAALNMTYSPTEFVDIMKTKESADVTIIAGDMSADIEEAKIFLNNYFGDEKVIFIGGNHIVYNKRNESITEILDDYKREFNGKWKFLENDYVWLNDDIAVIGCIGWTDYKYHDYKLYHDMRDEFGRPLDQEGNLLPEDPTETPEFKAEIRKIWNEEKFDADKADKKMTELYRSVTPGPSERVDTTFKNRVSEEVYNNYMSWFDGRSRQGRYEYSQKDYTKYNKRQAFDCMNDFRCGKIKIKPDIVYMKPDDCLEFHKESKKVIKECYKEILTKNSNATIILVTHHPFTTKCKSERFKGEALNAAFMSDCDKWLKNFQNIKYYHCGHVHSRFFNKLKDMQIICNPMGYLYYNEHKYDKPFDINYIIEV